MNPLVPIWWPQHSVISMILSIATRSVWIIAPASASAMRSRNRFLVMAFHASPCAPWTQACLSKSSCATRLKASAATVLSKSGVVMPHVQREQHQPLKSSPSTRIRCLSMEPAFAYWIGVQTVMGNLPWNFPSGQVPKVLRRSPPKGQGGDVRMPGSEA